MRSLASLAGVFTLDNQGSGLPDEIVVAHGLPPGAGRGLFEADCYTCSHCQRQVVMNKSRTRPRGFCSGCNKVICDECDGRYHASGHQCIPFVAFAEEVRNAAVKGVADPVAAAEFHFNKRLTR